MPKSDPLDEINKKIIAILLENARISFSGLSKKVGISRAMIANRIAHLEKSGVIIKYTAVVTEQFVLKPVPAFFNIKVDPKYIIEAAEEISTYEDIVVVYQMSGNSALHVHGYFEEIKADIHL